MKIEYLNKPRIQDIDSQVRPIKQRLRELEDENYVGSARQISDLIKPEVQTSNGLIRRLKDQTDTERKFKLDQLIGDFTQIHSGLQSDLDEDRDLDEDLNSLCNEMLRINQDAIATLPFDYLSLFSRIPYLEARFPNYFEVNKVIQDEENKSSKIRWRLMSIIGNLVSVSLSQGSKSQAGEAGENLVRATLGCIGLEEGRDYRSQWKGGSGSETDFVIPHAENRQVSTIKVFIAAQFSSNDRARMASSELRGGALRYLVTGNGMDASTKGMREIGADIVEDYSRSNTKIVCRKSHIENVLEELRGIGGPMDEDRRKKINYFENFHLSFHDFAQEMKSQV